MDKVKKAKILLDTIKSMIQSSTRNLPYNRKAIGVITAVNGDETVNLTINNEHYQNIKVRSGVTVSVGNLVWVEIPNSNLRYMFVDMKL